MRIGIAQLSTRAGDFEATARSMADYSRRAAEQGVDLLVYPAATLCGLTPVLGAEREGLLLDLIECLSGLMDELACPCLVPVLVDLDGEPLPDALLIDGGEVRPVRLVARLESLASGSPEGEDASSDALPEIPFRGARLGVAFTYDDLDVYDDYAYDVDVIVFLSPYGFAVDDPSSALGSSLAEGRFPADARATGAWVVGVGSLGCYDTQLCCGSSFVLAPWGELAASAPSLEEALLVCDVDPSAEGPLSNPVTPEVYDPSLLTWGALGMGLSSLVGELGSSSACVALDGSLPSLLAAVLAVDALGPTNVRAAVAQGGPTDADRSRDVVRALRLPDENVTVEDVSPAPDAASAADLLQLRLAAVARESGAVALGSLDKTGRALEPATLSAAALQPFADLYRSDLLALARMRNAISPVLPVEALAEVRVPDVVAGEEGLGSPESRIEFADLVLSSYVEWELSLSDIVAERGHADAVRAVVNRLRDLETARPARVLAPTVSSRTLDEARDPFSLAWRDRPRPDAERLAARLEEFSADAPGATEAPEPASEREGAHEGDILDLLGYLRDFSAGGGFSSLDAGAGKGASGRHGGQGQPPAADPWDGPFSEN